MNIARRNNARSYNAAHRNGGIDHTINRELEMCHYIERRGGKLMIFILF